MIANYNYWFDNNLSIKPTRLVNSINEFVTPKDIETIKLRFMFVFCYSLK